MATRRCHFPDDSVSPSPPPTQSDIYSEYTTADATPAIDYLSALPQELIEEIGLLTCAAPFPGADYISEPLFVEERHRLRTLHALSLTSKQFNQIFNHLLYIEPLVIDTQYADSSKLPNSATMWLNPSCHEKAPLAKRFTLWRPRCSEEDFRRAGQLCPVNPFVMLFMLTNIRELTLSGNFRNSPNNHHEECHSNTERPWIETTLIPKYVPHLTSVRLLDVDDATVINILLIGIAHKITNLEIHPSSTGISEDYSPRSVFTTLRPMIESLNSLESLTISLPGIKYAINHCNHAHKLIQKSLFALPSKQKLKHFSISLPLFDCRSMPWADISDSEEDDDNGGHENSNKAVDHAWFWMTLQNFLGQCNELETFNFKGSSIPFEIERKLHSCCLNTKMSFSKAQNGVTSRTTSSSSRDATTPITLQQPVVLPLPNIPPPPPVGMYSTYNNYQPTNLSPVFQFRPPTATWRPIVEPYPEPAALPTRLPFDNPLPAFSVFDFQNTTTPTATSSSNINLPPIYENFQLNSNPWQQQHEEQSWETNYENEEPSFFNNPEFEFSPEFEYEQQEITNVDPQNQDWDWYIQYDQ